jgi:hypothetical protein
MVRIGLVLHPRRDSSAAVAQVRAWTSTHGVELVAATDDVTRLGVEGVVGVAVEELARTCDGIIALGGDCPCSICPCCPRSCSSWSRRTCDRARGRAAPARPESAEHVRRPDRLADRGRRRTDPQRRGR